MPYLYLIHGTHPIKAKEIQEEGLCIGHHGSASLSLAPVCPKNECVCLYSLNFERGNFLLKTGKKTKPFFQNGSKEKKAWLQYGDVLQLCKASFLFTYTPLPNTTVAGEDVLRWTEEVLLSFEELQKCPDVRQCYETLLAILLSITHANRGFAIGSPDHVALEVQATSNVTNWELEELEYLLADPILSHVRRTGKLLYPSNPQYPTLFQASYMARSLEAKSICCLPIPGKGDNTTGVIFLGSSERGDLFDPAIVNVLELVGKMAATHLNRLISITAVIGPAIETKSGFEIPEQAPPEIIQKPTPGFQPPELEPLLPLKDAIFRFREWYIAEVLSRCGGNKTKAAKALAISVRSMFRFFSQQVKS